MCSKSNVTCPGVRTISFEATLGFLKRTFVYIQPALLYRKCIGPVTLLLSSFLRLSLESVMSQQFFKCQVIRPGLSKVPVKYQVINQN